MLIVNADDFGLAPHINKGIIEAVEQGAVNSVSLVANGKALDEAVAYSQSHRNLNTGIHCTLIDEIPLSAPRYIPSLVGKDGRFHPDYRHFILRYILGRIRMHEIKIELEAQIKRLMNAGIAFTHCDSHQHLHLLPGISSIVLTLCQQYRIPRLRIVNERPDIAYVKQMFPLILMNFFSWKIRKKASACGIGTARRFFGFNTSMRIHRSIIKKALLFSKKYDVELMTHPGYNTEEPGRYGRWNMDWDREREELLAALTTSRKS
jgi:predicted glycoside hydrolase/deacetylase ChbG (UPF0249 family)